MRVRSLVLYGGANSKGAAVVVAMFWWCCFGGVGAVKSVWQKLVGVKCKGLW